ncbi:hypothetical protein DAETH_34230 (plasmid) [Deinococcus aetherius]|uniref:PatA-like N-terminal domain-containing protein n=1 Tax=Deinococcus aetherius TaxID=200252 RepID=A0ABN6RNL8_9DEIO|nr:DUF4388 domain-containing protein [Deinococcus aetherius]BDP43454.1 hypothetical protein DAETH_34230 [Deinococcus aetherius]
MNPSRSVLFVMGSFARGRAHALLGSGRGLDASFAEGALYALTRLERIVPDLIVCDETLADMGGEDFFEIVRNDPATARCPFLLIAREKPARLVGPLDLWHAPGLSPQELIGVVLEHLERLGTRPPEVPGEGENSFSDDLLLDDAQDGGPTPDEALDEGGAGLHGTLELIGLFDLLTFLNQMRKSGQLLVQFGEVVAQFVLDGGEVVSAEYGVLSGEAAFSRTFAMTEATPGAPFTFHPLRQSEVRGLPHTITTPTQHLMLEATVQLDHTRAAHG